MVKRTDSFGITAGREAAQEPDHEAPPISLELLEYLRKRFAPGVGQPPPAHSQDSLVALNTTIATYSAYGVLIGHLQQLYDNQKGA